MTSIPDDEVKNTPAIGQGAAEESEEEEPEKAPIAHPYVKFFDATIAREFLGKSWWIFSMFFGLYYLIQFGLALMCANFYSMSSPLRMTDFEYTPNIGGGTPITNDPLSNCGNTDMKALEAAKVFDDAFFLMGIFHIIEWIRTIILLTSTCMGGVFLLQIYQLTALNAIYGFVAYVMAHYAYFTANGQLCAQDPTHKTRGQFMVAELFFFYIVYGVCILFVLAFPKVAYELANGSFKRREATRKEEEAKRKAEEAKKAEADQKK